MSTQWPLPQDNHAASPSYSSDSHRDYFTWGNFGPKILECTILVTSELQTLVWLENKGADEFAAWLQVCTYFHSKYKKQHLIAYSDSCSGQNKKVLTGCTEHKCLLPGHAYMSADTNFRIDWHHHSVCQAIGVNYWQVLASTTQFQRWKWSHMIFSELTKCFINHKVSEAKRKVKKVSSS